MPYIQQDSRELFDPAIDALHPPGGAGDLNYIITRICLKYIEENGGINYQKINDIVGSLDCAKMEFYSRLARPYEIKKIELNGDCYPPNTRL